MPSTSFTTFLDAPDPGADDAAADEEHQQTADARQPIPIFLTHARHDRSLVEVRGGDAVVAASTPQGR